MPRIRVKKPGGTTGRIEVPTSASFGELKLAVEKALNPPPGFQLSLNKQSPVQAKDNESVAAVDPNPQQQQHLYPAAL
ncbi:hypothetical protein WJX74_009448 [Apatococcus lobatus]|uniref:Ubiquitin-like domain-containing protein n=1 Tax=Apatococcus lobatus TaxID=904363 RepID=A0AAW1RDU4_9CHLO